MATSKVTFTLDAETVRRIEQSAIRLDLPKSQIVRQAIHDFDERTGRVSPEETKRLLRIFDTLMPLIPPRPQREVDRELREIRAARRSGGRRTRNE